MPVDKPAAVTLVTGPEALLRDRAVAQVVQRARRADPTTEVHRLSAVGLEPGRVTSLADPSLFGELTVIVVDDAAEAGDDLVEELKAYVSDPSETAVLVLVHPGGVKGKALVDAVRKTQAAVLECKALKWESDKIAFVREEFARARRAIHPDAAAALVDAVGNDLRELASSSGQLIADTSGTVEVAEVERYHAGRVEASGFNVADATVEGRVGDALRLLRHALATGVDPVPINAAIAAGLRNLAKVGGLPRSLRPDDVARELGIARFQVTKAKAQVAGWSPQGVASAISAVAHADEQIKGGGTDPVYALERAITAIGAARGMTD